MQAKRAKDAPEAWLEMTDIFGDVAEDPVYRQAFTAALTSLWARGTVATLTAYLRGTL